MVTLILFHNLEENKQVMGKTRRRNEFQINRESKIRFHEFSWIILHFHILKVIFEENEERQIKLNRISWK